LSASGQLHRLQGLAISNRAGNYWKPIPLYLKAVTIDRKERLWGIDLNKRLVSHKLSFHFMLLLVYRIQILLIFITFSCYFLISKMVITCIFLVLLTISNIFS
ncbi:unnamed protein product, partial [Brugia timori]|uniref:Bee-milk protein n=1 Tax=Brugia timori TaxID=42155 RepID=A0A0R3QK98_9BILA